MRLSCPPAQREIFHTPTAHGSPCVASVGIYQSTNEPLYECSHSSADDDDDGGGGGGDDGGGGGDVGWWWW